MKYRKNKKINKKILTENKKNVILSKLLKNDKLDFKQSIHSHPWTDSIWNYEFIMLHGVNTEMTNLDRFFMYLKWMACCPLLFFHSFLGGVLLLAN